ncbi:MAG: hypothetical protein QXD13_00745 [Candidatus Pacearchaeota archaeon]
MRIGIKGKKGELQLSFGMIFSTIIVIAILGVGFYVITNFISLSRCTNIGLYYNSLKEEVNKAWEADSVQKLLTKDNLPKIPSGIEKICIGNLTQSYSGFVEVREELARFSGGGRNNFFFYPPEKACEMAANRLEHIKTDRFFCVNVKNGGAPLKLSKSSSDALVTISAG